MRVIIIGGTRFIGPEVVRQLLRQGHEITVFHRGETNDERTVGARHILGDRASLVSFRDQFQNYRPDLVLDMFPHTRADARLLADTFRGIVPRVVAISSMDVYRGYGVLWNTEKSPVLDPPFTEDSPLRTSNQPHGEKFDKISVEKIVMNQPDFRGTILRLPMVYGKSDRQHRLHQYLKRMDDGRKFILLDEIMAEWKWTRGYVENVAAAICMAIVNNRAAGKIYNVGEKHTSTERAWIEKIARCVRWPGRIVTMPDDNLPEHLRSEYNFKQHMECDTSRIGSELGYTEPIKFEEAMIRAVDWERKHPPAKIKPEDFDYDAEDKALEAYESVKA